MKFLICLLSLVFLSSGYVAAQEYKLPPTFKCHYPRKDRSFCKRFPQFSLKHNICNPEPKTLGNTVWKREDVVVTEKDECGKYVTYEAMVVTYRPVYCNGALGKKFTRTYRKEKSYGIVSPKNPLK